METTHNNTEKNEERNYQGMKAIVHMNIGQVALNRIEKIYQQK